MGSSASAASRMVSEIWSAILSGWPSVTDSEVKRWEAFSFWSSAAFQVVIPTVFSAILYSPRFRLKSSPPPFYVSLSAGEFGWKVHHVGQTNAMRAGQNRVGVPPSAPVHDPDVTKARSLRPPRK